jgi:hypothetical protein
MSGSGEQLKVALRFWSWQSVINNTAGPRTMSQRSEPLDLVLIARRHQIPEISHVRAIAFSKYGDLLLLVLEHRASSSQQHPSSTIMSVVNKVPPCVRICVCMCVCVFV